jgi:hypothetical protein
MLAIVGPHFALDSHVTHLGEDVVVLAVAQLT